MVYLKHYIVRVYNDNGDLLEFGNHGSYNKKIMDFVIDRNNRVGIMQINIDNKNESFNTDFLKLNRIEVFLLHSGQEVKRFSGTVEENRPSPDNTFVSITCHDNNGILARRDIVGVWRNIDLGLLVKTILQEKCPEIDVTEINISTGIILDLVQSASLKISDFLDDLFKESNYDLFIDDSLVAKFYEDRGNSKLVVVDSKSTDTDTLSVEVLEDFEDVDVNDNQDVELLGSGEIVRDECLLLANSLGLRKSNVSNVNSITVIGGNEQIDNFIESFTYVGSKNFPLRYKVANVNPDYVKVNGTPVSQETDYDLSQGRTLLHFTVALSTSDTIEISYTAENPIWWKEQDPSVSSDKIREETINDPTILTLERAQSLAIATLSKNNSTITKGPLSVINVNSEFFKGQTIELNLTSFSGDFFINGYTETVSETYIVDFALNRKLDEQTKKIYELIKDMSKVKNSNQQIQTVRDGFTISDVADFDEELEGYEYDFGDAFMINDPVQGQMNSPDYFINGTLGGEHRFL